MPPCFEDLGPRELSLEVGSYERRTWSTRSLNGRPATRGRRHNAGRSYTQSDEYVLLSSGGTHRCAMHDYPQSGTRPAVLIPTWLYVRR